MSCWTWKVVIPEVSPFFAVYCCLAVCLGKKWILGRENHFFNGKVPIAAICWGFSFLRCLLLLGRLPRKNWILGRENHFLMEKCRLPRFADVSPFCVVYCCLAGCPGKKRILGRENHFFGWEKCRLLRLLKPPRFCIVDRCLADYPGKMIFGSGKSFSVLVCFFVALVDLFVVLVLCLLVLCLLFLFFVLLVWWFVLFPKRLRVGIQCPQWGKNTCEDCQKDWSYWPILGGYRFFFFLIVLGD